MGDGVKRGKDVLSGARDHFEALHPPLPIVQHIFQIINRRDIRQVAFVVLQDVGNFVDRNVLFGQIVAQVLEAFDILLHFFPLRISHENHPIHAAQDELSRGVIDDLTRNRIKLELVTNPFITTALTGRKSKNKVRIRCGRERNQVAAIFRAISLVDMANGRFPAKRGTVIDNELNLAAGVINDRYVKPPVGDISRIVPAPSVQVAHGFRGVSPSAECRTERQMLPRLKKVRGGLYAVQRHRVQSAKLVSAM